MLFRHVAALLAVALASTATAAGKYLEVSYPPSAQPGELQLGVTYTIWIPEGVAKIRGIVVHQHGCGPGAKHEYRVIAVNSTDLKSEPSKLALVP